MIFNGFIFAFYLFSKCNFAVSASVFFIFLILFYGDKICRETKKGPDITFAFITSKPLYLQRNFFVFISVHKKIPCPGRFHPEQRIVYMYFLLCRFSMICYIERFISSSSLSSMISERSSCWRSYTSSSLLCSKYFSQP